MGASSSRTLDNHIDLSEYIHPELQGFLERPIPEQNRKTLRSIARCAQVSVPLRVRACEFYLQTLDRVLELQRQKDPMRITITYNLVTQAGIAGLAPLVLGNDWHSPDALANLDGALQQHLASIDETLSKDETLVCVNIVVGRGRAGVGNILYREEDPTGLSPAAMRLIEAHASLVQTRVAQATSAGKLIQFNHVGRGLCGDGLLYCQTPLID